MVPGEADTIKCQHMSEVWQSSCGSADCHATRCPKEKPRRRPHRPRALSISGHLLHWQALCGPTKGLTQATLRETISAMPSIVNQTGN